MVWLIRLTSKQPFSKKKTHKNEGGGTRAAEAGQGDGRRADSRRGTGSSRQRRQQPPSQQPHGRWSSPDSCRGCWHLRRGGGLFTGHMACPCGNSGHAWPPMFNTGRGPACPTRWLLAVNKARLRDEAWGVGGRGQAAASPTAGCGLRHLGSQQHSVPVLCVQDSSCCRHRRAGDARCKRSSTCLMRTCSAAANLP